MLAEKLGRFVYEIDKMPYSEFVEWVAFYEISNSKEGE